MRSNLKHCGLGGQWLYTLELGYWLQCARAQKLRYKWGWWKPRTGRGGLRSAAECRAKPAHQPLRKAAGTSSPRLKFRTGSASQRSECPTDTISDTRSGACHGAGALLGIALLCLRVGWSPLTEDRRRQDIADPHVPPGMPSNDRGNHCPYNVQMIQQGQRRSFLSRSAQTTRPLTD